MKLEDNRDFVWELLQSTRVFESMFDTDPMKHAFNAGRRDVGLNLVRDLKKASPEFYIKMIQEHIDG